MNCFLLENIKHTCEYNAGGITQIRLIDIRNFTSYTFRGDRLYDQCYVERINLTHGSSVLLDHVNESNFTETSQNGLYTQQLTTFVRSIQGEKTSRLLLTNANKYLVVFRTFQGRYFCFASDGGASVSFSQITGQTNETEGYSVTISKNSIYPLFECAYQDSANYDTSYLPALFTCEVTDFHVGLEYFKCETR